MSLKQKFINFNNNFVKNINLTNQFAQYILFYVVFAILFGIGFLFKGEFEMTYWISEFEQQYSTFFKGKDIVDLVTINLIFPIFAIWVRKLVKMDYEITFPNSYVKDNKTKTQWSNKSDFFYYFFLAVVVFGNTSHVLANRFAGELTNLDNVFGVSETIIRQTDLFVLIYFWDEYFGHLVIGIGIYGMAMVNLHKQIQIPMKEKMTPLKWFFVFFGGLLLGSIISGSMMEGQSNFPLLILNIIILFFLFQFIIKHINKEEKSGGNWVLSKHPIIIFLIISNISFIALSVVWSIIYGIMPHYPFFYQPGKPSW